MTCMSTPFTSWHSEIEKKNSIKKLRVTIFTNYRYIEYSNDENRGSSKYLNRLHECVFLIPIAYCYIEKINKN